MAIISAYAGLPPWEKAKRHPSDALKNAGWQWQAGTGEKRLGRRKNSPVVKYGTGGWSTFNEDAYSQRVKKDGLYLFRLYNGKKTWVPGSDVDEAIGATKLEDSQVNSHMAALIESAWEKSEGQGRYYEFDVPDSHITKVRYNPSKLIMEVTFGGKSSNRADTVTFLYVPKEIMATMEWAVDKKGIGVDGKSRSLIGIKFWDLVRIRGTRTGARYVSTGGTPTDAAVKAYRNSIAKNDQITATQAHAAHEEATTAQHPSDAPDVKQKDLEAQRDFLWDKVYTKFKSQPRMMSEFDDVFGGDDATQQDIDNMKEWMSRKGVL